jgi:ADP-ribose pyrophosphatase
MPKRDELVDLPTEVVVSPPQVLAKAYRDYYRYRVTFGSQERIGVSQERDVLTAGKVVLVIPVDPARREIVMLRQFRLPAHLANGAGDLVELVAGRVEKGESLAEAARRECQEEIGVTPKKVVELFSYLSSPGLTDEEVTVFLAGIDAAQAREGAHVTSESEQLFVWRVPIDAAIEALDRRGTRGGPLTIGLQWLALNRERIADLLR